MTHECTLKEAFIIKSLDETQPDWRTGADVRRETKDKIRERVAKKYADIFDPDNSACITFRSIEKTVSRIRDKLDITALRDSNKDFTTNQPIRAGSSQDISDSPTPKPEPSSEIQATAKPFEPMQSTPQSSLSPEVRTYLESSGLSAEETRKFESNPHWLALSDTEKKRVIDNNLKVEKELAENADRMKKLEEEREANWKQIKEEERNDPNRNPKTADPDVIFFCEDCITPFRIKHSDRESCPACHSTNIQYSDFAMSCGGGNCWRPRPLKDSLTICPCGCGFGYDDEGKWYSPAQYEGVMV